MTSANQPHYEDSPPVTVQSAPTMPTATSAQYCSSSHNALRTLGFALLAAGTVSALAAIACYMYLNRGVYNPADAILLLVGRRRGVGLRTAAGGRRGHFRRCMEETR